MIIAVILKIWVSTCAHDRFLSSEMISRIGDHFVDDFGHFLMRQVCLGHAVCQRKYNLMVAVNGVDPNA